MLVVVTGGSGSGKSAFAEDRVLSFGESRRIYIATMQAFAEESHRRIEDIAGCGQEKDLRQLRDTQSWMS